MPTLNACFYQFLILKDFYQKGILGVILLGMAGFFYSVFIGDQQQILQQKVLMLKRLSIEYEQQVQQIELIAQSQHELLQLVHTWDDLQQQLPQEDLLAQIEVLALQTQVMLTQMELNPAKHLMIQSNYLQLLQFLESLLQQHFILSGIQIQQSTHLLQTRMDLHLEVDNAL